jgi:hypothetical protein
MWDLNLSKKGTKRIFFFNFWSCSPNFCTRETNNFGTKMRISWTIWRMHFSKGSDELLEQSRVSYMTPWTKISTTNVHMETLREEEKWVCCCKRSRTARCSIRMGWYHMVSEVSGERFEFWARSSPLCASQSVKLQVSVHGEKPETAALTDLSCLWCVRLLCPSHWQEVFRSNPK